MRMKRYLKKNPDSTVSDYYMSEGYSNFNLWRFLSGLLIPLLSLFIVQSLAAFILLAICPVILALILKHDRITMKSVLLGFGISVVLVFLVGLIIASALGNWQ